MMNMGEDESLRHSEIDQSAHSVDSVAKKIHVADSNPVKIDHRTDRSEGQSQKDECCELRYRSFIW